MNGEPRDALATSPHKLLELGLGYTLVHNLVVDEYNINILGSAIVVSNAKELSRLCKELENTKISIANVFRIFNEVVSNVILFRRAGCYHIVAIVMPNGWVVDIVEH